MVDINNTLTVGELRDLLANYHDSTPVLFVNQDRSNDLHTINHALDAGWRMDGDKFAACPVDSKNRIGTFVGLLK